MFINRIIYFGICFIIKRLSYLWHSGTKIGNNLNKFIKYLINGFVFPEYPNFVENCYYLLSNKIIQELECLYEQYKSTRAKNI